MRKFVLSFISAFALQSLSFGQQPPGTDIYLFDLVFKKGKFVVTNSVNITDRKGYDNQPFFHPEKPFIYYASADDEGRTDIVVYNHETGRTQKLTNTSEREYSPTVTPDKKFISCIIQRDNGAQDLGKYPIDGGDVEIIVDNLTVGYHAWRDDKTLFLFVLGQPNTLHEYAVADKTDRIIAENIGRSLHRIPGTSDISFVDKSSSEWTIKKIKRKDGTIETVGKTLPGREDLTWTPGGKIIMSDGVRLFYWTPGKSKDWTPIEFPDGLSLSGITRLTVDAKGNKIAVVANE
ncbi:MAG: hypothetical protein KF725_01310 [Cyclobacteriaceae bacterium]|nr:hypothetical protein [Cyclobacteriaceae bacterium]UYN86908.1 MAG: hypothetical protein KIT51_01095 [Cyclobacteriaceae bacterium]